MKIKFLLVGYGIGILLGLPMFYSRWQWWVGQAIGLCFLVGIFLAVRFVTTHNSRKNATWRHPFNFVDIQRCSDYIVEACKKEEDK